MRNKPSSSSVLTYASTRACNHFVKNPTPSPHIQSLTPFPFSPLHRFVSLSKSNTHTWPLRSEQSPRDGKVNVGVSGREKVASNPDGARPRKDVLSATGMVEYARHFSAGALRGGRCTSRGKVHYEREGALRGGGKVQQCMHSTTPSMQCAAGRASLPPSTSATRSVPLLLRNFLLWGCHPPSHYAALFPGEQREAEPAAMC